MKDLGYTWTWQEDGVLKATTPRLEAIACVPDTSTRCFFNQLPATTNNAIEFSNVGKNDETQGEVIDPKPTQEGLNKCLSFGDGTEIGLDILLDAKALCTATATSSWTICHPAVLVMHPTGPRGMCRRPSGADWCMRSDGCARIGGPLQARSTPWTCSGSRVTWRCSTTTSSCTPAVSGTARSAAGSSWPAWSSRPKRAISVPDPGESGREGDLG